jgi:hypothetical protein
VERNGKYAVGRIERLLDPVTVVDVDVHDAIAPLEMLKDAKDAARDGAETGGLTRFAELRPPAPLVAMSAPERTEGPRRSWWGF